MMVACHARHEGMEQMPFLGYHKLELLVFLACSYI